jgi:hypothetical protein
MPFVFKILLFLVTSIAALAADKDNAFKPGPAASYETRQTVGKVTVAAIPYHTEAKIKTAFGKVNPYKHGVLPVLVVIQNDGAEAISAGELQVELLGPNRGRVEATPPAEVRYAATPGKPTTVPTPVGGVSIGRKKNPLDAWEIEGRAFAAKMIPPGETAHGFVYFKSGYQQGSRLYLTGLREAATGKELFYFEIPLD